MINLLIAFSTLIAFQQSDDLIRLRDGRVLFGKIEQHNLDGFRFVAAKDGGQLQLVWSDLFPGESERLHQAFGYVQELALPMVTAQRLLLNNGNELVGRVISESNSHVELRTKDNRTTIPKTLLAAPIEEILVEAQAVLTGEQYYSERVTQIDATDGLEHFKFAKELQLMFALERAKEHFLLAQAIAEEGEDQPLLNRLSGALSLLEQTIANQEEAQSLEKIRQLMYRERFAEAENLLEEYDAQFPNAALRADYIKLQARFEPAREDAMISYMRRHWFARVVSLMKKQALEKTVRMDSLMAWAQDEVSKLVRQQFVEELSSMHPSLTVDMIDQLWMQRADFKPASHTAGYGNGTWVLGEERARVGLKPTAEEEAEESGKSAQQKEMEERMKRYLDNLKSQRNAAQAGDEEERPEDWWLSASVTSRFQWLLAYYAEFSGDYELQNVKFAYCPTCGGQGFLESLEVSVSGSQRKKTKCPTCHGVQVKRSLNFK